MTSRTNLSHVAVLGALDISSLGRSGKLLGSERVQNRIWNCLLNAQVIESCEPVDIPASLNTAKQSISHIEITFP